MRKTKSKCLLTSRSDDTEQIISRLCKNFEINDELVQ